MFARCEHVGCVDVSCLEHSMHDKQTIRSQYPHTDKEDQERLLP